MMMSMQRDAEAPSSQLCVTFLSSLRVLIDHDNSKDNQNGNANKMLVTRQRQDSYVPYPVDPGQLSVAAVKMMHSNLREEC